jgi:hypothetical protein
MGKWIINIILGALVIIALLTATQWVYNFYAGVWML